MLKYNIDMFEPFLVRRLLRGLLMRRLSIKIHHIAAKSASIIFTMPCWAKPTDGPEAHLDAQLVVPGLEPTHLLLDIFDF